MNKTAFFAKLEKLFDEMQNGRSWGTIEIEFREGDANMIRTCKHEKIQAQGNTRGQQPFRNL